MPKYNGRKWARYIPSFNSSLKKPDTLVPLYLNPSILDPVEYCIYASIKTINNVIVKIIENCFKNELFTSNKYQTDKANKPNLKQKSELSRESLGLVDKSEIKIKIKQKNKKIYTGVFK